MYKSNRLMSLQKNANRCTKNKNFAIPHLGILAVAESGQH